MRRRPCVALHVYMSIGACIHVYRCMSDTRPCVALAVSRHMQGYICTSYICTLAVSHHPCARSLACCVRRGPVPPRAASCRPCHLVAAAIQQSWGPAELGLSHTHRTALAALGRTWLWVCRTWLHACMPGYGSGRTWLWFGRTPAAPAGHAEERPRNLSSRPPRPLEPHC
jgi:hypothetical protein